VCIDLQPCDTTHAPNRSEILNVGGFREAAFSVMAVLMADNGQLLS